LYFLDLVMSDSLQLINWPKAIATLRQRIKEGGVEPTVFAHLRRVKHALLACSGGADSVFMLCVLAVHAEELDLQLHVAHYNHRWRGEESKADAAFVEELADVFQLPYYGGSRADNEAAFTETTARLFRLEFLRNIAQQTQSECIVFGHQLDDIIETQLQRIARGCGSDGLAAPRPISRFEQYPTHVRPLLHLRAREIRMALHSAGIPWREDSSNNDLNIARNALRQVIIPDLTDALGRDPSVGAARSRRLLEEDAAALDLLAREYLPQAYAHEATLPRERLRSVPVALLRRGLSEWLRAHGLLGSIAAPAMDILIDVLRSDRESYRMSAGAHFIVIDAETLAWEHSDVKEMHQVIIPATLQIDEPIFLSTGALMAAEVLELDSRLRQRIEAGEVEPGTEAFIAFDDELSLQLRGWLPGDRFQPLGAPGSKKLKNWFIDRRIPQAERKMLPLVLNATDTIIWVPGFPPAESCKILPTTKRALRLTYQSRKPL
jgi:tRNA(Ile)-lysidine synthase